MTFVPICARATDAERVGSAGPDDPLVRLIQRVAGETDLDSLERFALSEGLYSDSPAVKRAISRAIASGLLITRAEFLKRLRSRRSGQIAGQVNAVGILSTGRWNTVARSAAGILTDPDFRRRGIPLAICDDSDTRPGPELHSLRTQPAAATGLRLIGHRERERYLALLLTNAELKGIDQRALTFGLRGGSEWAFPGGANRNWWLLETAGLVSVLVDDDVGPESLTSRGGRGAVASSNFHPLRFQPYPEPRGRSPDTGTPSFVQAHGDIIGRSASDLLTGDTNSADVDLSSCRGELAHSLLELNPVVVAGAAGIAGHPGWRSRRLLWHLQGSDRQHVVEDRGTYRRMSISPSVLWSADRLTISHSPFFRGGCASFNSATALPPFPPVGRNEDGVLGLIIHRCFAPGSIAHVPMGVVHHRPPADEHDPFAFTLTTNEYLSLMLQDCELPRRLDSEPMHHVESLGAHLAECASVPPAHFANYLADLSHEQANAEYRALTALLDLHHGRPKWWAREVRQRVAMIDRYTRDNVVDVSDIAGSDRLPRINRVQLAARMYGELLQMWPAVYRVARELRESGNQPSRSLFSEDST